MRRIVGFWGIALLLVAGLAGLMWNQAFSEQQDGITAEEARTTPLLVSLSIPAGEKFKQGDILLARLQTQGKLPSPVVGSLANLKGTFFEQSPGIYEAVLGIPVDTKPGTYRLTVMASSGTALASASITVLDAKFPRQNITVSKSTKGLQPLPGELEAIQALKVSMTPIRYWKQPFISPTPDCENSPFGVKRYHNGVYTQDYHKGVDLRSPHGRPIRAIADGVVKIAAPKFRLHGGTVGLDHGQGVSSIYIHMSKVAVKPGDTVKKGDAIGYVGATGFATGPHLHWGLYANGVPVNPDRWIPVPRC